ncbi:MAG: hypothetical protein Fur0041_06430 [Bacteroidia bacterium]
MLLMENKRKILIIDDEPDIREFLHYNLSKSGYEVFTAENGKAGLQLAYEQRPDLIILDVLMPVLNGYETCMQLRNDSVFDQTHILFLSALRENYVRELGLKLMADGFISKPVKIPLLVKKIGDYLAA